MKRTISFLIAVYLYTASLHAQQKNVVIRISGNTGLSSLIFSRIENYGLKTIQDTLICVPGKQTVYKMTVRHPINVYVSYGVNKQCKLWITPGGGLDIDLAVTEPAFTGRDAMYAAYYQADKTFWLKINKEYHERNPEYDKGKQLYSDNYFKVEDSIITDRLAFLSNTFHLANDEEQRDFLQNETRELMYTSLFYKLAFSGAKLTRFSFYQAAYNIPKESTHLFSEKVVFNEPSLFLFTNYRRFAHLVALDITLDKIKRSGTPWSIERFIDTALQVIDAFAANPVVNRIWKVMLLDNVVEEIKQERKMHFVPKIQSVIAELNKHPDKELLIVKAKIDKIIHDKKFDTGSPAPDFTLKDASGKVYSLADFKGKKIYIDMGASWCGPCNAAIPSWNQLVEENNSNENLVFIAVSLDDKQDDWMKHMKQRNTKGLNLFAGGFSSSFAKDYEITAIPHYLLLDQSGKIIRYGAPSPESAEIRNALAK